MPIGAQLEKIARDVASGPSWASMLEMALAGGVVGGIIGFAKERDKEGVKSGVLWGAGLGVAGQYLLFHALKPALGAHAPVMRRPLLQVRPRFRAHGEVAGWDEPLEIFGAEFVGDGEGEYRPPEKCPPGFHWEKRSTSDKPFSGVAMCVPDARPPAPPLPSPTPIPLEAAGWGHGEMMGSVHYPYYYWPSELPSLDPRTGHPWTWE